MTPHCGATFVGNCGSLAAQETRLLELHRSTDARCKHISLTPVREPQGTMGKCKVAIPRSAAASLEALINSTLNYHLPKPPPAPPAARPPPPLLAPPGPPLGVVAVGRLGPQQQPAMAPACPPAPPGLRLMTLPLLPLLPDFDLPPLPMDEGITPEELAALGF